MATYQADSRRITYLIPFSYGNCSDVSVRIVQDGVERTLVYETDYRIVEHCVVLTPDENGLGLTGMLLIDSATSHHAAEMLEAERVQAAAKAGLWEKQSAWFAERAARIALDCAENATAQCETAKTQIENLSASRKALFVQALTEYAEEISASQNAYMTEALAKIYAACYEAVARANNPGIAAIKSMEDLKSYSAGCFIINPHLMRQTPFMGFYPVRSMEPVTWDGIFVIVPNCPGHNKLSNLTPPNYPSMPGAPVTPGDGAYDPDNPNYVYDGTHWLPCGHEHY